jgi:hypothetical protein
MARLGADSVASVRAGVCNERKTEMDATHATRLFSEKGTLVVSRTLEKNGETLYVVVDRMVRSEASEDLFRLRAHFYSAGSSHRADASNLLELHETGNKIELRLTLAKVLLDKRDEGWIKTAESSSADKSDFWQFDTL